MTFSANIDKDNLGNDVVRLNMNCKIKLFFSTFLLLSMSCSNSVAETVSLERIATGLDSPLYVTAPVNDNERLFVLEKNSGEIKIIQLTNNQVIDEPFLTVDNISTNSERGLLGLAFHPDYESNGELYVSVTNSDGDSEVRRYQRSDNLNRADPNSEQVLITIPQFASNHNGGWVGFGPDGYLYIALGDGGSANDPQQNGQDLTTLLSSLLRIDINGDDFPGDDSRNYRIPSSNPFLEMVIDGVPARPEIWAYGLRNPWRPSFDRSTGDLIIADVGQGEREEVNFQLANSEGGENYGWRLREGEIATPSVGGDRPSDNIDPIYTYERSGNEFTGRSITGGYRYRGPVEELTGKYFFADFTNGRIWSLVPTANGFTELTFWSDQLTPDQGTVGNVSSFGEDANGNLYVVDFDGDIFKFISLSQAAVSLAPVTALILESN